MNFWHNTKQVKLSWAADPTSWWVLNGSLGKAEPSEETCLEAKSVGVSKRKTCWERNYSKS